MSSDNPVQSNGVVGKTRRLAARGIRAGAARRRARRRHGRRCPATQGEGNSKFALERLAQRASTSSRSRTSLFPGWIWPPAAIRSRRSWRRRSSRRPRPISYDNPVSGPARWYRPSRRRLLYSLIRNLRPDHVFEIGAYKAGTTEAICRALFYANGKGIAHAVDPFRREYIAAVLQAVAARIISSRPTPRQGIRWRSFGDMERHNIHPALVFVDGNHDYEFAAFDIACGARAITPGGYIVVDNVAQPGPFFAVRDFLAANPAWRELGTAATDYDRDKAFDHRRSTIVETDFMVLRAPVVHGVGERPFNRGRIRWNSHKVVGLRLKLVPPPATGTAHGAGRVARLRRGAGRDHRRSERPGRGGCEGIVDCAHSAGAGRRSVRLSHGRAVADLARRPAAAAARRAGAALILR